MAQNRRKKSLNYRTPQLKRKKERKASKAWEAVAAEIKRRF